MSRTGVKSRRLVTITEAAELCDKSEDTIRRRLKQGHYPTARAETEQRNSPWLIPVNELGLPKQETDDEPTQHETPIPALTTVQQCGQCAETNAAADALVRQLAEEQQRERAWAETLISEQRNIITNIKEIATHLAPSGTRSFK